MTDQPKSAEIEDVLSSIRRLVAGGELRTAQQRGSTVQAPAPRLEPAEMPAPEEHSASDTMSSEAEGAPSPALSDDDAAEIEAALAHWAEQESDGDVRADHGVSDAQAEPSPWGDAEGETAPGAEPAEHEAERVEDTAAALVSDVETDAEGPVETETPAGPDDIGEQDAPFDSPFSGVAGKRSDGEAQGSKRPRSALILTQALRVSTSDEDLEGGPPESHKGPEMADATGEIPASSPDAGTEGDSAETPPRRQGFGFTSLRRDDPARHVPLSDLPPTEQGTEPAADRSGSGFTWQHRSADALSEAYPWLDTESGPESDDADPATSEWTSGLTSANAAGDSQNAADPEAALEADGDGTGGASEAWETAEDEAERDLPGPDHGDEDGRGSASDTPRVLHDDSDFSGEVTAVPQGNRSAGDENDTNGTDIAGAARNAGTTPGPIIAPEFARRVTVARRSPFAKRAPTADPDAPMSAAQLASGQTDEAEDGAEAAVSAQAEGAHAPEASPAEAGAITGAQGDEQSIATDAGSASGGEAGHTSDEVAGGVPSPPEAGGAGNDTTAQDVEGANDDAPQDTLDDDAVDDDGPGDFNLFDENGVGIDESVLRELIADVVRSELQGALGERVSRNIRRLVQREVSRALMEHGLEDDLD